MKRWSRTHLSANVNPFPSDIFYNLKTFADDNFKFDENSKKFSKPVVNTVEKKGEIAH